MGQHTEVHYSLCWGLCSGVVPQEITDRWVPYLESCTAAAVKKVAAFSEERDLTLEPSSIADDPQTFEGPAEITIEGEELVASTRGASGCGILACQTDYYKEMCWGCTSLYVQSNAGL